MNNKVDALQARKELLMMKAELERMEMRNYASAVRKEFAWVSVFKRFGTWLGPRKLGALGVLAQKYPLVGMVASTALVGLRKPLFKAAFRAGIGALVFAAGAYWLRSGKRRATPPSRAVEPTDTTNPSGS